MLGEGKGLRPWVYYSKVRGFFSRLRSLTNPVLIGVMLVLPWISVGGARLLMFDVPGRRVYAAGMMFTPLDTRFLLVVLLMAAVSVALMTAVAGRVWCGYLCPQTVFLDGLIRPIEVWLEGDRGERRRLDESAWTPAKLLKKATKWGLFGAVSLVLAATAVSYFTPAPELWTLRASPLAYAFVAVFTGALYFDLSWFREQFCNYLCPYARFQGALTDIDSLVIGYDPRRGEPRLGSAGVDKKSVIASGGCVDCGKCVAVCPQGIDIRNGYQLECIACGRCVDACTDVMGKLKHPSLVNYTTERDLLGLAPSKRRVRPFAYATLFTVLAVVGTLLLVTRNDFDARVTRTRGSVVSTNAAGQIQNTFDGHIWNNDTTTQSFHIRIEGLEGATVVAPNNPLTLESGDDRLFPVFVVTPPESATHRSTPFEFVFEKVEDGVTTTIRRPATFLANPGHS